MSTRQVDKAVFGHNNCAPGSLGVVGTVRVRRYVSKRPWHIGDWFLMWTEQVGPVVCQVGDIDDDHYLMVEGNPFLRVNLEDALPVSLVL